MQKNPLDNIKIASPCSANWDEMYGDNRRRFCAECKLNVYNLSQMTAREAENFLFAAEGRVCVKLYRRTDGTVITQDCPVGWQAVKQKVSRFATAAFGLIIGFFGGLWTFNQFSGAYQNSFDKTVIQSREEGSDKENIEILLEPDKMTNQTVFSSTGVVEKIDNQPKLEEPKAVNKDAIDFSISGGVSNMDEVKMWIFTERFPK